MKSVLKLILTAIIMAVSIQIISSSPTKMNLGGKWEFKQSISSQWREANVPGQVQLDLLNLGLIPDPYVGTNEKDVQWVGEKEWEYKRTFSVDQSMLSNDNLWLVMEGIDTYADVYINGYLVEKCDNMFRTWRVDAKRYLKEGDNQIRIFFYSVFRIDMPKYIDAPFRLQSWPNNDQNDRIWLSLYARKAGYNYGWDWGPRLITAGIWRDIYLESWNSIKIDGVQIITKSLSGKKAKMSAGATVVSNNACDAIMKVSYNGTQVAQQEVALREGDNELVANFVLKNPKLWWSKGLGEPNLCDFIVEIANDKVTDSQTITTGIRTVEIVREHDEYGQSMFVRLNGKDVFMKGANWIPLDNFPTRVSDSKYEHIIKSAADVNMNMLRIWGGGIYEKEIFYDLCDRYGILVWQDAMFACGMFPADTDYLNSVAAEVQDNAKRIRNHPCVALWNGNNENEVSYFGWGWKYTLSAEEDKIFQGNHRTLFYDVIPQAIYSKDKTRYYHPTSPNTGYNGVGHNMGDVHFWGVWKGGWFEEFEDQRNIGRFMSEYGFQSYPDMFTIRKFASNDELYLNSKTMHNHQKVKGEGDKDPNFANNTIKMYMRRYFTVPENFEHFIYMSQILQAEGVKMGIEAHRRAMPYCMGTLFWQINDCWPVASWSSIDYYGRWKALHYYNRDAFSEVLVSPHKQDGNVNMYVVSDRQNAFKGVLNIETFTLDGQIVYKKSINFNMPANTSIDVVSISESELLAGSSSNEVIVNCEVLEDGKQLSENIYYPEYSNKYDYPKSNIKIEVVSNNKLILSSDKFVRGLYLWVDDEKTFFEDNYVTLLPGRKYDIGIKSSLSAEQLRNQLRSLSINDINK